MSSADAAWLRMDRPTNLMIVNSVLWFDEPVDWDRCKAVFLDRIVARFDRFRQRAADGLPLTGPHWEDDLYFDPDLHFHHVALPAPHDRAALQDFIADRISTPLDHSRPLWEVYLIDDFGARLRDPRPHPPQRRRRHRPRTRDADADRRRRARRRDRRVRRHQRQSDARPRVGGPSRGRAGPRGRRDAAASRACARARVERRRGRADARKLLLPGSDPQTAIKGEQSLAHRVAWSAPVPLWRVKRAGRTHGATVNDVLVSAVTAAVGRHLARARG